MLSLLKKQPDAGSQKYCVKFIDQEKISESGFLANEQAFIEQKLKVEYTVIPFHFKQNESWLLVKPKETSAEKYRRLGADLAKTANTHQYPEINVDGSGLSIDEILAFSEGFELAGYRFVKYFSPENLPKKKFSTEQVNVFHQQLTANHIQELNHIIKAVFWARNQVNEPVNHLNAERFSYEVSKLGQEAGFAVEILDKLKIESLRMGGLLSVNKGSIDPPTFTICQYKPANAKNKKPYVLVGKGITFDTGGLSLKPTPSSMDYMKSDMAGAAAVAASIYAIALNQLPVWIIGLLPATDNRPDGNAFAPGDIIKMYNGLHVEVMNTDAEGRLILADGLSYGDKFEPELICTVATLTGSASMAVGQYATVFMGNAPQETFNQIIVAGDKVNERLVQFPFWDEYGESLKTNTADLKNLGAREGGAISAGKFLEHFTKSPYIHFDIAGPAFINADTHYTPKGATGIGVRLFTQFFKNISYSTE